MSGLLNSGLTFHQQLGHTETVKVSFSFILNTGEVRDRFGEAWIGSPPVHFRHPSVKRSDLNTGCVCRKIVSNGTDRPNQKEQSYQCLSSVTF